MPPPAFSRESDITVGPVTEDCGAGGGSRLGAGWLGPGPTSSYADKGRPVARVRCRQRRCLRAGTPTAPSRGRGPAAASLSLPYRWPPLRARHLQAGSLTARTTKGPFAHHGEGTFRLV